MQEEIDRLKAEVQAERDGYETSLKKLRAVTDDLEDARKKIVQLEARPSLPLPESEVKIFQKKFDGLIMHGKTGLGDAFEIARAALRYEEDEKVKTVLDRLFDRTKHELNWTRDNGAELIGTVCRGGKCYSFANDRQHKETYRA